MNWPVSRARLDLALHNLQEMRALHQADVAYYRNRIDALTDQIIKLKAAGANFAEPSAPVVTSPMADLGPLTRAALAEMANGQSGAVVRAMRNKALALWVQLKDAENQDEKVAHAVYRGEAVGQS